MKTLHVYPKNYKTRDAAANKALLINNLKPLLEATKVPVPQFLGESFDAAVARADRDFDDNTKALIAKLADSTQTNLDYSVICSHA
jgi:hypothetical protein